MEDGILKNKTKTKTKAAIDIPIFLNRREKKITPTDMTVSGHDLDAAKSEYQIFGRW